jgi:starvation-inducible DNA-binding protein
MWLAIDTLAERIRSLGEIAPQGHGAFGNLTAIRDGNGEKDWEAMVSELKADQDIVIATARSAFPAAELAGDQATMDLITQRLNAHETHAWMLRATLGET